MFNLLPENLKEKIKSEYKLRRWTLILTFILFLQASFLILLSPSWFSTYYKEKNVISEAESLGAGEMASSTKSVVSTIKSINSKLVIINSALEYPKVIIFLNDILSKKTGSIHLNEFIYTSTSGKIATVSLNGISNTRESLVAFEKSLESSGLFKNVDLPVSNLAKDRDINFSLGITIAP